MPEKMSQEKVDVLRALGAEIVRTPTEAAYDSPESHISVAKRLNKEIPNSVILDQYANPYNPLAHYDTTAEEILKACDGRIDMFVAGAGTGGTITGVARKLKEKCPDCIVVGVDPHGSILAQPDSLNSEVSSYKVEGIGYDFIPRVLDRSVVDRWIKSSDLESFTYSRRLIREEGILAGGSSGSAMWAAMEMAKTLKPGQRCVVLLADSVRNYMSKFLNDDWMVKNGFALGKSPAKTKTGAGSSSAPSSPKKAAKPSSPLKSAIFDFGHFSVADLHLPNAITVSADTTCAEAARIMQEHHFDQVPVTKAVTPGSPTKKASTDGRGHLVGLVTLGNILSKVAHGRASLTDAVSDVMFKFDKSKDFKEISEKTPLKELTAFFDTNSAGVVTAKDHGVDVVKHVVTKFDLVAFMVKQMNSSEAPAAKKAKHQ